MARQGARTGLLFLLVTLPSFQQENLSTLPLLIMEYTSAPSLALLEQCMYEYKDVLLTRIMLKSASALKKRYPDNCLIIVCIPNPPELAQALEDEVTACDYVVSANEDQLEERLRGIIQAEQSRRLVINAQAKRLERQVYQQTATALLLNDSATHRIAPRVILPVGKQMRTKSVPWGKMIRGGTRGTGRVVCSFSKTRSVLRLTPWDLRPRKHPCAQFQEKHTHLSRGKMEEETS